MPPKLYQSEEVDLNAKVAVHERRLDDGEKLMSELKTDVRLLSDKVDGVVVTVTRMDAKITALMATRGWLSILMQNIASGCIMGFIGWMLFLYSKVGS